MAVEKRVLKSGEVVWDVKAYLGIDPETGKRIQKTERNSPTKSDALDREAELRLEYRNRKLLPADITVAHHLDKWYPRHARDLEPVGALRCRAIIDRDLIPVFGHILLRDLTPSDIQDWIDYLVSPESGRGRNGQGLAPRSMQIYRSVLMCALQEAEDLELMNRNPARRTKITGQRQGPTDRDHCSGAGHPGGAQGDDWTI